MARKRRGADEGAAKVSTGEAGELKHNPFASLMGGASLPAEAPAAVIAEPPTSPTEGGPRFAAKVVVRRETKGRKGKAAVRVSGVDASYREAMAGELKRAFGCGVVLDGDDVIVLGDLGDRTAAWLEAAGARRVVRGS